MTNEPKDNPDKVGYKGTCQADYLKGKAEGFQQALKEVEEMIDALDVYGRLTSEVKFVKVYELKQAIDQLRGR